MMTIFIDAGPFVGAHNISDQYYDKSVAGWAKLATGDYKLLTTEFILDEVYTRLITKAGYSQSMAFDMFLKTGSLVVERITSDRFISAQEVFRRFNKDKKRSFTDCTSYVVMKELKIKQAFTFDKNFAQMGFEAL